MIIYEFNLISEAKKKQKYILVASCGIGNSRFKIGRIVNLQCLLFGLEDSAIVDAKAAIVVFLVEFCVSMGCSISGTRAVQHQAI